MDIPQPDAPKPKKSLLIAIIAYNADLDVRVANSINASIMPLAQAGWQFALTQRAGEADLGRTRNGLAAEMYAGPFSHVLSIDGDVAWDPAELIQFVNRALVDDLDLLFAPYPRRDGSGSFHLRPRPGRLIRIDPKTREPDPERGLLDVLGAQAGFMMISRNCITRMREHYPDRWYNDVAITGKKAWSFWEFFPNFQDRERYSEDFYFCKLWRDAGGTVWVDPSMRMTHIGRTAFTGRLSDKMRVHEAGTVPADFLKSLGGVANASTPSEAHTHAKALAKELDQPWGQQNRQEMGWLLDKLRGAKSVLEIGSCFGRTLEHFASVLAPGAVIRAIDLGRSDEWLPGVDTAKPLRDRIAKLKEQGFDATAQIADSHSTAAIKAAAKHAPYDLVFIDGDHTEAGTHADWKAYGPMGRMVAFHDIANPGLGVKAVWETIKASGWRTEEIVHTPNYLGIGVVYQ